MNMSVMMGYSAMLLATTAKEQPPTDTGSTLIPQVRMLSCFHEAAEGLVNSICSIL